MNNLIAIETSTQACSVAVAKAGKIVTSRFVIDRQAHSQQLLGMIQSALIDAELTMADMDAVACTIGPGTFTGVRIGIGVAKGLAWGQDIPIISASSLMAVALTAYYESSVPLDRILVMNDARMQELYWANFSIINDKLISEPEQLSALDTLPLSDATLLAGTGLTEYQSKLSTLTDKFVRNSDSNIIEFPTATALLQGILDGFIDYKETTAEALRPNYLRNKIV